MSETSMILERNPNINEETVNSLRKKLDCFTASNTQYLKDDIEFTRDFMVQFLLFFDRLIFNAASEKASSPITQNEMNNMDADKICSMAEVFAPYFEFSLSNLDPNNQLGGKKIGGLGYDGIFKLFISIIVLFMINSTITQLTGINPGEQLLETMVNNPVHNVLHQKDVAQQKFSEAISIYNNQVVDTYFKPNEATIDKLKKKITSFTYDEEIDYATLMTLYDKTLDAFDNLVTTDAEPFQITFNDNLPKKPSNELTIRQQTELFEQIIAPVFPKHENLKRTMRKELFLTDLGSCNNNRKKGERTPRCFASGFPTSFEEAQAEILMIENSPINPSLTARIFNYFKSSDKYESNTCDINYMIPSTVTLNGEKVNFVDTLVDYTSLIETKSIGDKNIKETIEGINKDLCDYKKPGIELSDEKLLKTKIGGKWKTFKRSISAALHPDKVRGGKEMKKLGTKQFQNAVNMFESVESSNDILAEFATGGKRTTRKRGKRNSKRVPRKNKTLRKKKHGKK
jgi:hypothetical protein